MKRFGEMKRKKRLALPCVEISTNFAKKVSNPSVKEAQLQNHIFLSCKLEVEMFMGERRTTKIITSNLRRFMLQTDRLFHFLSISLNFFSSIRAFLSWRFFGRIVFLSICQFEGQSTLKHMQLQPINAATL